MSIKRLRTPEVTLASLDKARKMKSAQVLGKWWEQELKDHFEFLKARKEFYYHRFPDTNQCGNYLPDQPSDWLTRGPSCGALLVEAKASKKFRSLHSCLASNVSTQQALHHYLWRRAGGRSVFIFCGVMEPTLQLWDGGYVADHRREGRVMKISEGGIAGTSADHGSLLGGGLLHLLEEHLL